MAPAPPNGPGMTCSDRPRRLVILGVYGQVWPGLRATDSRRRCPQTQPDLASVRFCSVPSTSAPMASDLALSGPVNLHLHALASA